MNKKLTWTLIILTSLAVILIVTFNLMQSQTKKASPEGTAEYVKNDKQLSVFYCRPSKRGREIFGGLVPYGKVWRTGANEATTFSTATNISIKGQTLPAGKYTLWTIPEENEWTVIFNAKQYSWGIRFGGEVSREADADMLSVTIPVQRVPESKEMFTISFEDKEELNMVLAWDKVRVAVPVQ